MRIGIIGGGLGGAAVAGALLDRLAHGASIVVIEPAPVLGAGVAYGQCGPEHLLNVSEEKPRAFPDSPRSFLGWVQREKGASAGGFRQQDGSYYFPRRWFGEYVQAELAWRRQQRKGQVALTHLRGYARQIVPNEGRVELVMDDGKVETFDGVVLAMGNAPPRHLAIATQVGDKPLRVVQDPWDSVGIKTVALTASRVAIIGTGLTMSDLVLSLRQSGYRGEIVAISRHGYLPNRSRARMPPYVSDDFPACNSLTDVLRAIRTWCAEAEAMHGDWRPGFEFARLSSGRIWKRLSREQRLRFKGRLKAIWDIHRYPMPPTTHDILQASIADKSLRVVRGTFLLAHDEGVDIEVGGVSTRVPCDAVINATGPDRSFSTWPVRLSRLIAHTGLDVAAAESDGVLIDSRGAVSGAGADLDGRLWAVGSVARQRSGELTTSTDIGNLAIAIADDVVATLQGPRPRLGNNAIPVQFLQGTASMGG